MGNDAWGQWRAFAEKTARANPATAPFAELAERFADAARAFLAKAADSRKGALEEAAASFGDFLRDQSMAHFRFPWSIEGAGTTAQAPWAALDSSWAALDASWAALGSPWAALADQPALGLTREHQERWQRMADAAQRAADAQRRLQRLWADALRDAAREFTARIGADAGRDRAAKDAASPGAEVLRGLYDSWIGCAERAYGAVARSEAFSSALADFVNAGSSWRRESIASIEQWSKLMDLPTRGEINSLNCRLMEVEEQLRAKAREPAARKAPRSRRPASRSTPRAPRTPRARAKRAPKS